MTSYGKYIVSEEYQAAAKCRTKIINDVERYIRRVRSLASEDPDAFVFEKLRRETEEAIKELDVKQNACLELIADNCADYTEDEKYISDLDAYDAEVMAWLKILSTEAARVQGSTTVKVQQNDMTQVILDRMETQTNIMQSAISSIQSQSGLMQSSIQANTDQNTLIQNAIQATIDKNSKSGPKPPTPTAPSFCPTGDHNDDR